MPHLHPLLVIQLFVLAALEQEHDCPMNVLERAEDLGLISSEERPHNLAFSTSFPAKLDARLASLALLASSILVYALNKAVLAFPFPVWPNCACCHCYWQQCHCSSCVYFLPRLRGSVSNPVPADKTIANVADNHLQRH